MDIKTLWGTVKAIFSEMFPIIWPSIKIVLTQAGKYTLQTAVNIVQQVQAEMPNASGQEKAAAAFARISAVLLTQGIQVGNSVIKIAIEYAYQHMMAEPEVIQEAKDMMMVAEEEGPIPEWVK